MIHSLHIGAETVRSAADKVLASQTFARSEKLRNFLRYVVDKEQRGEAQALKGYAIGIDVFNRPVDFDPTSDPLVRVQAGKLRKLLERYYEEEGAEDPVRIRIPTGGYVPRYQINPQGGPVPEDLLEQIPVAPITTPPETPATKVMSPAGGKSRRFAIGLTALNMAVAAFSIFSLFAPPVSNASLSAQIVPAPSTGLPMVFLTEDGKGDPMIRAVGKAVLAASVRAVAVDMPQKDNPARIPASPLSFRLDVKSGTVPGNLTLAITHTATGNVVYRTALHDVDTAKPEQLQAVADDLVAATMTVSGDIYRFSVQNGLMSDLMQCMAATELYNRTNTRLAFFNASACQTRFMPGNQPGSIYSDLRMLRDAIRSAPSHTTSAAVPTSAP